MQGLALSILPMFQEPSTATALLLETIALAFHAHVIHRYGDGLEAKLPSARDLRLGSCGALALSSMPIFAMIPRSLSLRESVACPPAISRALFDSRPAWRPIGGS